MTRRHCQENGGMFCLRGRCPADAPLACHLQQVDPLEGTVQFAMAWGHSFRVLRRATQLPPLPPETASLLGTPLRVLRLGHADLPLTLLWGCLRCETGQKCQKSRAVHVSGAAVWARWD